MVIPALVLARWWAVGGSAYGLWRRAGAVESAEGEDGDWFERGRMDEEMGKDHTEMSDSAAID